MKGKITKAQAQQFRLEQISRKESHLLMGFDVKIKKEVFYRSKTYLTSGEKAPSPITALFVKDSSSVGHLTAFIR